MVKSKPGTCASKNLIYCFFCSECNKPYVGRTVTRLNIRCNKHRSAYYRVLKEAMKANPDFEGLSSNDHDDTYSLGLHLVNDHGCTDERDFNRIFNVFILETCSPASLEVTEHKYIHSLKSLRPMGLNTSNPFNIRLLDNVFVNYVAS